MDKVEFQDIELGLLDHIPMGLFVLSEDYTVLFWNKLMEDWTSIPREVFVGRKITDTYPHLDQPIYSQRINSVFEGGPPTVFSSQLHKYIIPIHHNKTEYRMQHTTITSIQHSKRGRLVLFAIQDVTDLYYRVKQYRVMRDQALTEVEVRKKTEIELRLAKEKAEKFSEKLKTLSALDGLTGIANRRSFDEHLFSEWRRAIREKSPISLIMIDIDYFKNFNDNYGHQAGDECLRIVAEALETSTGRAGDLVARYGGEEFSIILPNTGMDNAIVMAERTREIIEKLDNTLFTAKVDISVTISLGVASVIPGLNSSPDGLVEAADYALYRAKRDGRNRVKSKIIEK